MPPLPSHRGILGGARSGKSRFAQTLAQHLGQDQVLFLATATPTDGEMASRIARHQRERPPRWQTCESPLDLVTPLTAYPDLPVILLDCVSLWVANHLLAGDPPDLEQLEQDLSHHLARLFAVATQQQQTLILVSNEVGHGVVPAYPLGRQYRDLLGWVNQQMTQQCQEVHWLLAGIPIRIKPSDPRSLAPGSKGEHED